MKILKIVMVIVCMISVVSCSKDIDPQGPITTIEKPVAGFTSIETHNGIAVNIAFGDVEKVTVETYENIQQYVQVYQTGTKLYIHLEEDTQFASDPKIKVWVSAQTITDINASGGSKITVSNTFEAESLNTVFTGGSSFSADLQCRVFSADLSGGSTLNLQGQSDSYSLNASGGSKSNGFDLVVNDFNCDLSGGSIVNITVNNELNVIASGGSVVNYKGTGTVASQVLSGGSSVNKK